MVNYVFSENGITFFPNSSNGEKVNINFKNLENKEILVVVKDIEGKEHYSKINVIATDNEIIGIDLEDRLTTGVYIITASSHNILYIQKLVIK
jgi:hypothetical protein